MRSILPIHHIVRCFFLSIWCIPHLSAQCNKTVSVAIHSINFVDGCEFDESNGLDAVLEIRDNLGNEIYLSEFENLSQVRNPQDSFIIDLNVNPNSCGNQGLTFELGVFPSDQPRADFRVDIFDRDNIFPCAPFFALLDDDHGGGTFSFDLNASTGVIDMGSCISFNYNMEFDFDGTVDSMLTEFLCYNDDLIIGGETFDRNNPIGQVLLPSALVGGCDTIVDVNLTFRPPIILNIPVTTTVCPLDTVVLEPMMSFSEYIWNTGARSSSIVSIGGGDYSLTVTDNYGCQDSIDIMIFDYPLDELSLSGDTTFCYGGETTIAVDDFLYEMYIWDGVEGESKQNYNSSGNYNLAVIDAQGCRQELDFSIIEEEQDTFYMSRSTCDQNAVGVIDSIVYDAGCEILYLIEQILSPDVDCNIEVVVEQIRYPCEETGLGQITISMIDGSLPFDFWLWSYPRGVTFAGSNISNSSEEYKIELPQGNYEIEAWNDNGAMSSVIFEVEQAPELQYDIETEHAVISEQPLDIELFTDFAEVSEVLWIDELGDTICRDCQVLNLIPSERMDYELIITDIYGCMYRELIRVTLLSDGGTADLDTLSNPIFIPNIFSPGSSDLNNELKVYVTNGNVQMSNYKIYDRWGSVIYVTTDINDAWDGTYEGKMVASGVYVLCIELTYNDGRIERRCEDLMVAN